MIPATGEPTEEHDAGAVPGVSNQDRIGSVPPALPVGAAAPEVVIPRLHGASDTVATPMFPSPAAPVAAPVPPAQPTRIEPGFASLPPGAPPVPPMMPPARSLSVEPAATVVPSAAAPEMTAPRSVSPMTSVLSAGATAPVSPAAAFDADADGPTLMVPPRSAEPSTIRVEPPLGITPSPAVTPPPMRPSLPPPLPPEALPPPRMDATRRATLPPQQHPMPTTITPTEPVRKRSRVRSKAARSSVVVVFDGLISLATIVALVLFAAAFAGRQEFELPGPLAQTKVVVIPPKKTREEIGDLLEKAGVITSGTVFLYGSVFARISDLKAGEYEFHAQQSMHDVAEQIHENKVVQHKITFPEGWTSEQIVQRLLDDPILTGKIVAIPEEGSLLPDTYTYPMGETRQQILDRMHKNQDRRLTEVWAHRNAEMLRQLKVPKDLVILASIIEKETSKAEERPRIAAVFVNRLNRNMRLETDPTILYGLYGGKAWTEPRTLTKADLIAPNPYNTYKINGLPPGPISNPGRAALEAAANPAQTNEIFFVADGTGGHAFSETIEEHNRNVAKWREIERQRHAADPNSPLIGSGTGVLVSPPTPAAAATPAVRTPTTQRPATQRPRPRTAQPPDLGTN